MGRIIKPMEIANQVYSIKSVLSDNRNILYSILIELRSFEETDELQGYAWGNAKEHMHNHEVLVLGLIALIEQLILSGDNLVLGCGNEDLDENVLIQQKKDLISERSFYENELYRLNGMDELTYNICNDVLSAPLWGDDYTLEQKKFYYKCLINNVDSEIDIINSIISKIDDIENNTCNLFSQVKEIQEVIGQGLGYLKASYQDTGFIYPIGWDTSWKDYLTENFNEIIGLPEQDKPALISDVEKIEASKTDGNIYFSEDKQSIIYGGEMYKIVAPSMEYDVCFDNVYERIITKEKTEVEFNWAEAIIQTELEAPDYTPVYAGNTMVYNPSMDSSMAAGVAVSGLINFMNNGLDRIDICVVLKNAQNEENNKALIYLGSVENRNTAQQLNYDYPMSLLDAYDGNRLVQRRLSEGAFNLYNSMTGGNKVQGSKEYDIIAEFNSDRQFATYDRYISFDADGNMIVTPMRYEGERVYIVECEDYLYVDFKEVLDITDYMFESCVVESSKIEGLINSIILDDIEE